MLGIPSSAHLYLPYIFLKSNIHLNTLSSRTLEQQHIQVNGPARKQAHYNLCQLLLVYELLNFKPWGNEKLAGTTSTPAPFDVAMPVLCL